jgi:hypothetical protein
MEATVVVVVVFLVSCRTACLKCVKVTVTAPAEIYSPDTKQQHGLANLNVTYYKS